MDQNTAQRLHVLQMKLALGNQEGTFESNQISLHVNRGVQAGKEMFSFGCQTDHILYIDQETENYIKKDDKQTQCFIDETDDFTQTGNQKIDAIFQTDDYMEDEYSQTETPKTKDVSIQHEIETQDKETIIENAPQNFSLNEKLLEDKEIESLSDEELLSNVSIIQDELVFSEPPVSLEVKRNGSESPPVIPESSWSLSPFSAPFSSIFNMMTNRLPTLGIKHNYGVLFCVNKFHEKYPFVLTQT